MKRRTRRKLGALAAFGLYLIALFFLWESWVVYPLRLFVVLLHEASHALAAVATGGRVEAILLTADEGGLCRCPGGNAFLTLSAGYLGSLAWGVGLFSAAVHRPAWARVLVATIGAGVVALTLGVTRNAFGLAFGVAFGAGLLAAARWLPRPGNAAVLGILGLTSCLYAIFDIKSDVLDRPHLPSDAAMLAEVTGIPGVLWGVLWIVTAVAVTGALLRWAWRRA